MTFQLIWGDKIICLHPDGLFEVPELGDAKLDFVAEVYPGDRQDTYLPILLAAPELYLACKKLYACVLQVCDQSAIPDALVQEAREAIDRAEGMATGPRPVA